MMRQAQVGPTEVEMARQDGCSEGKGRGRVGRGLGSNPPTSAWDRPGRRRDAPAGSCDVQFVSSMSDFQAFFFVMDVSRG